MGVGQSWAWPCLKLGEAGQCWRQLLAAQLKLELTDTHRAAAVQAAGVEKSLPAILLQIVTSRVKHCNKLVPCRNCGPRNTLSDTARHTAVTSFSEDWPHHW